VATGVEALEGATLSLLRAGAKSILTEKPGGMDVDALSRIHEATETAENKVFIAYNRRFYASVRKLRELISEDGGIKSLQYDFTERAHVVRNLKTAIEIKERWFIANSTHVVDLAFHLGGRPKDWSAWHEGGLDWHSASSRFCGAGKTDQEVLFNYSADWGAPGRWGLQVTTTNRRLILRPLEEIKSFSGETFEEKVVDIDRSLDLEFKPGIFLQTKAFLMAEEAFLCSAKEQFLNMKFYQRMAGYP
jgi:predicted dehydrogenase